MFNAIFQLAQLTFIKHTERIKHVVLILKVSYRFPVCVALLVSHTGLPSVWLLEQEIYDQLFTLIKYIYIRQKPVRAP